MTARSMGPNVHVQGTFIGPHSKTRSMSCPSPRSKLFGAGGRSRVSSAC